MSDDVVRELREWAQALKGRTRDDAAEILTETADRIEAQAREIAELKERLALTQKAVDGLAKACEAKVDRRMAAEARVAALTDGLKFIIHHGAKASRQTLIDAAHKALTENTDG